MGDDISSRGRIFVGGLNKQTTSDHLTAHFCQYGEIKNSEIFTDQKKNKHRGFGFVTFADPHVAASVLLKTHIINGKKVEVKKFRPKEFKTNKIFVTGFPRTVTEDELKAFFSKFGGIKKCYITSDPCLDYLTHGFGFIVFESERSVENILSTGNKVQFAGAKVEIKKQAPEKPSPILSQKAQDFLRDLLDLRDLCGGSGGNEGPWQDHSIQQLCNVGEIGGGDEYTGIGDSPSRYGAIGSLKGGLGTGDECSKPDDSSSRYGGSSSTIAHGSSSEPSGSGGAGNGARASGRYKGCFGQFSDLIDVMAAAHGLGGYSLPNDGPYIGTHSSDYGRGSDLYDGPSSHGIGLRHGSDDVRSSDLYSRPSSHSIGTHPSSHNISTHPSSHSIGTHLSRHSIDTHGSDCGRGSDLYSGPTNHSIGIRHGSNDGRGSNLYCGPSSHSIDTHPSSHSIGTHPSSHSIGTHSSDYGRGSDLYSGPSNHSIGIQHGSNDGRCSNLYGGPSSHNIGTHPSGHSMDTHGSNYIRGSDLYSGPGSHSIDTYPNGHSIGTHPHGSDYSRGSDLYGGHSGHGIDTYPSGHSIGTYGSDGGIYNGSSGYCIVTHGMNNGNNGTYHVPFDYNIDTYRSDYDRGGGLYFGHNIETHGSDYDRDSNLYGGPNGHNIGTYALDIGTYGSDVNRYYVPNSNLVPSHELRPSGGHNIGTYSLDINTYGSNVNIYYVPSHEWRPSGHGAGTYSGGYGRGL